MSSIVIATTALVLAADANGKATDAVCKSVLAEYDTTTATLVQMQEYASCVKRLYPEQVSVEAVLVMKAAVLIMFIGIIIGAVRAGWKYRDFWDAVEGAFVGALFTMVGLASTTLLILGVAFLFS